MWTHTRDGFFSVTNDDRSGLDQLMVRARVRDDLVRLTDRLATKFDPEMLGIKIIETLKADYRYRILLPRWAWREYMTTIADDIDYTNVKDTLAPMSTDPDRHRAMLKCWSAMAALQPGYSTWDDEDDEGDDEDTILDDSVWFAPPLPLDPPSEDAHWDESRGVWLTPERPSADRDDRPWCPNVGYACPECGWERGHHPRCP